MSSIRTKIEAVFLIVVFLASIDLGIYANTFTVNKVQKVSNQQNRCIANACIAVPTKVQKKGVSIGSIQQAEAAESNSQDFCIMVPVLMYHHIQPETISYKKGQTALSIDPITFDSHLSYLIEQGYNIITAKELIDALQKHFLPSLKSVVITLDDGYSDAYEYAFPILKKYNVKVELLIPTGLVEGDDYLTWSQLQDMKQSGIISIINHTWSHHNMNIGSKDELSKEIDSAQNAFSQHLKEKPTLFGYPYGAFNDVVIEVLREQGFVGGFSTIQSSFQCESSIMALPRLRIGEGHLSHYGL